MPDKLAPQEPVGVSAREHTAFSDADNSADGACSS